MCGALARANSRFRWRARLSLRQWGWIGGIPRPEIHGRQNRKAARSGGPGGGPSWTTRWRGSPECPTCTAKRAASPSTGRPDARQRTVARAAVLASARSRAAFSHPEPSRLRRNARLAIFPVRPAQARPTRQGQPPARRPDRPAAAPLAARSGGFRASRRPGHALVGRYPPTEIDARLSDVPIDPSRLLKPLPGLGIRWVLARPLLQVLCGQLSGATFLLRHPGPFWPP